MTPHPTHGARLTVDLAALAANYRLLSQRVAPAECAAVVKADAYGIGIEAAVPALAKAGCATFFVAHLSEAARVRATAPDATVYVLNGLLPGMAPALAAINARPVLGSLAEVADWRAFAKGADAPPVALHVDTGMNRLGLRPEELAAVSTDGFDLALVMSHFVSSEVPGDPVTGRQIQAMRALASIRPDVPRALANSSGFFLETPPGFALHRAGYALYGGNPTPGRPNPMRPVIRLDAPVIDVRRVPKGETVGYNAQWTAKRDSLIATVSVGYADGYPRRASATDAATGGAARIAGVTLPFAGRVSMDLITIDVTDAPKGAVVRGAMLALIDEVLTVDAVGESAGTIGYEVLTSLGRRYHRVYVGA